MSKTRSARLSIGELPRDNTRSLGATRQALCATFNYCRKYPKKMPLFKETIKYVHGRIVQWEKEEAAIVEAAEKAALEQLAKDKGIDLDSRKTLENMQKDYDKAVRTNREE